MEREWVMEGLRVAARVVALGVREPELHLDTEMLRVGDTVGVEDGHTLRVATRVVALGDTVGDDTTVAVLVAGHQGSRNAWMLMPNLRSRAVQVLPPLLERQPPVVPRKLVVENTPLFTVGVLTSSSDIVQVAAAKEMAMA
jgi:hypothetical protein